MGIGKALAVLGMVALSWFLVVGTVYAIAKIWAMLLGAL
jgi:hypothetical protein